MKRKSVLASLFLLWLMLCAGLQAYDHATHPDRVALIMGE